MSSVYVYHINMLLAFSELWDNLLCSSFPTLTMNLYALTLVHDLTKGDIILKLQSLTPFETLSKHRKFSKTIEFHVFDTCINLTIGKPYLHYLNAFMIKGISLKPKEALLVVSFFSLFLSYSVILRYLNAQCKRLRQDPLTKGINNLQ